MSPNLYQFYLVKIKFPALKHSFTLHLQVFIVILITILTLNYSEVNFHEEMATYYFYRLS